MSKGLLVRRSIAAAAVAFALLLVVAVQGFADDDASTYTLKADEPAYAILYSDGCLVFQRGDAVDSSRGSVVGKWTDFEEKSSFDEGVSMPVGPGESSPYTDVPWFNQRKSIKSVDISSRIAPLTTDHWFWDCSKLTSVNLSGLDASNVTSMYRMFSGCSKLKSLDLSGLDTSKVKNMRYMFSSCSKLTSVDLSGLDTSKVKNMERMFSGCSSLASLDLSNFDTSGVTNMTYMFSGCSSLASLDLSNFDTSNVTSMYRMFYDCSSLASLDLSNFDTSNVVRMDYMFYGCSSLASLDLSNFDTSGVTYMTYMFYGCSKLKSLNLSSFDTSSVENMEGMFYDCSSLKSLDLSGLDTSKVKNMRYMFYGCSSLTSLDLSSFNTSNVEDMLGMFSGCSSLASLDLSNFDTWNVVRMDYMFYGCSSLASLDLSNFDTSNIGTSYGMYEMFNGCSRLSKVVLGPYFEFPLDDSSCLLPDGNWILAGTNKTYTPNELANYQNSSGKCNEYTLKACYVKSLWASQHDVGKVLFKWTKESNFTPTGWVVKYRTKKIGGGSWSGWTEKSFFASTYQYWCPVPKDYVVEIHAKAKGDKSYSQGIITTPAGGKYQAMKTVYVKNASTNKRITSITLKFGQSVKLKPDYEYPVKDYIKRPRLYPNQALWDLDATGKSMLTIYKPDGNKYSAGMIDGIATVKAGSKTGTTTLTCRAPNGRTKVIKVTVK